MERAEALALAKRHHQAGAFRQAEEAYRQILKTSPASAEIWHLLGGACQALGKLDEAVAAFRQALSLEPNLAHAHNSLGIVLATQKKIAEAAACFETAARCRPGFAEAHSNLGNALKELGKLEQAEASYREALRLKPDFALAYSSLGSLLHDKGQFAEAAEACQQAVRLQPALAEAHNNLAIVRSAQGKLDDAAASYRRAIELRPTFATAHSNLGATLAQQGRLDEAAECCRRAVALQPEAAAGHCNLGKVLKSQGKFDEAIDCFRRALRLEPASSDALENLGSALLSRGSLDEAEACLRTAIRLRPGLATAHCNLGNALKFQGNLNEAVTSYREAIRLRPNDPAALSNLGLTLFEQAKGAEAIAACREALRIDPSFADAHNNLGTILAAQGNLEEAAECYRRAVQCRPLFPEAYTNLGNALGKLDRLDEAVAACEKAVELDPTYAEGHYNLGFALRLQGRLEDAIACYDEALRLKPDYADAHWNRALAWLMGGAWQRGWEEYEWRWRRAISPPRSFAQPRWDGSALDGRTVLLHAEQGLGDTLQFIRYAALVQRRGGKVVVECQEPLFKLLSGCPGLDTLVARGAPLPPFDVHAPLLSLPGLLGTTLGSVPADVPYLFADPDRVERWRPLVAERFFVKIGIAWQGNRDYHADRQRSIPLAFFEALARLPGVRLFSLQKGAGCEQLAGLPADCPVVDLGGKLDSDAAFVDTAAVMKLVDLVVTSDTAIAHLAGGLGVPTWVALPFAADWRWLLNRADSPWYPTMKLFRQQRPGDWRGVFERIAQALNQSRPSSPPGQAILVEVAPGELLDKISILEIKDAMITDADKLTNVRRELAVLNAARDRTISPSAELTQLAADLKAVNQALWRIEDDIRHCERAGDFGPRFIALARSVYHENDRRAALKRRINDLLGARLVEEKSYASYQA